MQPMEGHCSRYRLSQSYALKMFIIHIDTLMTLHTSLIQDPIHTLTKFPDSSLSLAILLSLYRYVYTLPPDLYTLGHAHALSLLIPH